MMSTKKQGQEINSKWTHLPIDLLRMISEKLTLNSDYVHLRAVCSAWKTNLSSRPRHLPPQPPWLIIPRHITNGKERLSSKLSFYDLSLSKIRVFDLFEIQGKYICGSSYGWLVLEINRRVQLFNPITRICKFYPLNITLISELL
jgi:F-box domain